MEQHPVPQNVTTFQFRLIGDMTIKQFGYLAGGAILAYICYRLPLPFFFTWPLTIAAAVGGFGLAFVPIEERPMDVWVLSFFKSVYSPTQFMWQKSTPPPAGGPPSASPIPMKTPTLENPLAPAPVKGGSISQTLQQLFAPHPPTGVPAATTTPVPPTVRATGRSPLAWLTDWFKPPLPKLPKTAAPVAATITYPDVFANISPAPVTGRRLDFTPPPKVVPKTPAATAAAVEEAKAKATDLEKKLAQLQGELTTKTASNSRILELQQQLRDLMTERNKMEHEIISLRQKLTRPTTGAAVAPTTAAGTAPKPVAPTVKVISPESAVRAGLPRLTTFPNVVTGIIKDHEGNLLPGVLVTVRDKDDIPLRALKTNKLGQFAASTPLPGGTYFVEIEDPRSRYAFDRAQITLTGGVLPALEIVAKSQKEISRDKLAREIFGEPKL